MWTNRYVVRKADGIPGDPIPDDEPLLVVRGQDVLARRILRWYIEQYEAFRHPDPQVLYELRQHEAVLREWQETHPTKMADR
jgi:hypothetical protein